jgi:hypothetical protein
MNCCGTARPNTKPTSDSKVKVKVKVTLEQAMKAQRGKRGIDLLVL